MSIITVCMKKCASLMATIEFRFSPSSSKRASTFSLLTNIISYLTNENVIKCADTECNITISHLFYPMLNLMLKFN